MKTLLRPRYYCEHCKKSGGSASHISRHEKSCTNNPNRVCRMCAAGELSQIQIAELILAVKADEAAFEEVSDTFAIPSMEHMTRLANLTYCPACILAAIRQAKACVSFQYDDLKKEFWDRVNDANGINDRGMLDVN